MQTNLTVCIGDVVHRACSYNQHRQYCGSHGFCSSSESLLGGIINLISYAALTDVSNRATAYTVCTGALILSLQIQNEWYSSFKSSHVHCVTKGKLINENIATISTDKRRKEGNLLA